MAIAASGLQQYRTYYDPNGEGLSYITALKATRCVATDAEYLLNDSPQPLWDAIRSLKQAIFNVQSSAAQMALASSSPALTDDDDKATAANQSDTGSDAAQAAVTAANSALSAALVEAQAYNDGPATVDTAHDAIKNYVDLKLHRTSVDYGTIQTAITNAVQSATTVESGVQQAQVALLAAVRASAKANTSSGATPTGSPPVTSPPNNLALATALIISPTATQNSTNVTPPAPPTPMTSQIAAQAATSAAKSNADNVASLIQATSNILLYVQPKPFTNLTNQISTTCVAGLSS